jgi:endonuclease/exonuclease/phosphatase (EEP) superfamily protein YafD
VEPAPVSPAASEPRRTLRASAARAIAGLAWLGAIGAPVAILVAWLVRTDPEYAGPLEAAVVFGALLVQSFTLHIGLAVGGLAIVAFAIRRKRLSGVLALGALLGLGPAAMTFMPVGSSAAASPDVARVDHLVVLSSNLLYARADADRLLAWIDEIDPDIIVLQEHDAPWPRIIHERLRAEYPHIWQEPRRGAFGQAILSRLPLLEAQPTPSRGTWHVPAGRVTVEHGARRVDVMCIHTVPPIGFANVAEQRRQIAWLAEEASDRLASGAVDGVILAGDFNAPFHTNHMRELRAAGLREAHSKAGRGRGATWGPGRWPLSLAPGIRLDHALFGGELVCVRALVGPDVGSDHRPIAAEFSWPR